MRYSIHVSLGWVWRSSLGFCRDGREWERMGSGGRGYACAVGVSHVCWEVLGKIGGYMRCFTNARVSIVV